MTLAAAAYYHVRLSRPSEWEGLPPREARLTLGVTHVFSSSAGRTGPMAWRWSRMPRRTCAG